MTHPIGIPPVLELLGDLVPLFEAVDAVGAVGADLVALDVPDLGVFFLAAHVLAADARECIFCFASIEEGPVQGELVLAFEVGDDDDAHSCC